MGDRWTPHPRQTPTAQAIVQRVRRGPVVVKAAQLAPSQYASQYALTRAAAAEYGDGHDDAWAAAPAPAALHGPPRPRPFPRTDLRRLQLLGMLDAMVNAAQPPPMHALYEVLSTLERFHAERGAPPHPAPMETTARATLAERVGWPQATCAVQRPSAPAVGVRSGSGPGARPASASGGRGRLR
ncbi:hypothetical protein KFE25_012568 [Diacronema lutheri]|uniref:Uncharacterized protein n=1 Tax=Diacronema lutheri TaxID=2081491 RepID=A0A8J5XTL7_DIALT|nr:hypothetical protein KFE25_012568 [Diacronema lutheri]